MSQVILTASIGLAAGIISSLLGVGGGIILVPGIVFALGYDIHIAVGTSLAIIVPTAVVGVLRHTAYGNVNYKAAIIIALASMTGAYLGAAMSKNLPDVVLKRVFALLLVIVAVRMFLSAK